MPPITATTSVLKAAPIWMATGWLIWRRTKKGDTALCDAIGLDDQSLGDPVTCGRRGSVTVRRVQNFDGFLWSYSALNVAGVHLCPPFSTTEVSRSE